MIEEKLRELEFAETNGIDCSLLKRELLDIAAKEISEFSTSALKTFPEHENIISSIIGNDIFSVENIKKVREILLVKKSAAAYEDILLRLRKQAEKTYTKYFHSYTKIVNGRIYNELIKMYWNEDGVWEIEKDGWMCFTAFMPYQ